MTRPDIVNNAMFIVNKAHTSLKVVKVNDFTPIQR